LAKIRKKEKVALETFSSIEPPTSWNATCILLSTKTPNLPLTGLSGKNPTTSLSLACSVFHELYQDFWGY